MPRSALVRRPPTPARILLTPARIPTYSPEYRVLLPEYLPQLPKYHHIHPKSSKYSPIQPNKQPYSFQKHSYPSQTPFGLSNTALPNPNIALFHPSTASSQQTVEIIFYNQSNHNSILLNIQNTQVQVIVDLCGGGSLEDQPATPRKSSVHDANFTTSTFSPSPNDANICRGSAKLPRGARLLNVGQPLQIGGLAHPVPAHALYGWPEPLLALPLHGCVRNLRINGQVGDQSNVLT
ncbi:hypothetical protein E2C01_008568 [Portunus trituberculatus]|uniref:Laminin G domain-containing protein n=1 Tax=Portunus trituberculatus TaxID=210409 RepID=A0A5B7D369_PORTR|nr:hypothetical protein [Portunus trituberculatus]